MKWSYGWQDIHQRFSACLQIGVSWEFCKMLVPEPHPQAQISIGLVWVGPELNEGTPGHSNVLPGQEPLCMVGVQ